MLFNSFSFVVFYLIVFVVYFLIENKYRWILLLIASYLFYFRWSIKYSLILIISTIITYYAGILIFNTNSIFKKKIIVLISFSINLALIIYFKYINLIIISINNIFNFKNHNAINLLNIVLPVGISFYIFQALGYIIDVYRKKIMPENNLGIYALYVSFFPQLVAGPIERSTNLIPQFHLNHNFSYKNLKIGSQTLIWGFFKKIVISNRLSIYVDKVYDHVDFFNSQALLLATILFSIQIYCDFSGYTDIAIGLSKILGINLRPNFKQPYFSKSISEFWSRWHISLSSWFRDYLYFPLGGNKKGKIFQLRNILIVFFISGLWHGANYTFIIWGFLHSIANIFEKIIKVTEEKINILYVNIFAIFTWIFFRSKDLITAKEIIKKILNINNYLNFNEWNIFLSGVDFTTFNNTVNHTYINICVFISIIYLFFIDIKLFKNNNFLLDIKSPWKRYTNFYIIIFFILFVGVFNNAQFIYFQF